MNILRTHVDDADFQGLVARLTTFLAEFNGQANPFYAPLNRTDESTRPVVAYLDGRAVGCGAFRPHGPGQIEIKRMFVDPAARGHGIGAAILLELERWAQELGHEHVVLETSRRLAAANRLYGRAGYVVIPNYGPYVGVEDSVCMSRSLA